jgi:DNA polymerase-4
VFLVAADEVLEFLQPLRLCEIPGVGPVTERKLHEMGVATLGQLAELDPGLLETKLGKSGPGLYDLSWGRDSRRVSNDRERSSYGSENTFNDDVEQREVIEAAVIAHSETVAWRLRRAGRCGVTVTLKYRPSGTGEGWRLVTRSRSLAVATDDGAVISSRGIRRCAWWAYRWPVSKPSRHRSSTCSEKLMSPLVMMPRALLPAGRR